MDNTKTNTIRMKSSNKPNNTRLALDIGTNSIGWAIYELNTEPKPIKINATGVRIFSSGRNDKDKTTLNATRRQKRLQRRQRDRYLQRRAYLLSLLKKQGLIPEDPFSAKNLKTLNPYHLRAKGLDEKLDIYHFGRALFHLNQKRGFKSNRKSRDVKEDGLINKSVKVSQELMKKYESRTYGEFLWKRLQKMEESKKKPGSQQDNWILARRAIGAAAKDNYIVYANRQMIKNEFNTLWDCQSRFHEQLKDKNIKDKFFKAIFTQRPLKSPIVGKCTLTGERRIHKALPSFQKFRILKELNNLAYIDNKGQSYFITQLEKGLEFRDKLITDHFLKKQKITFKQIEKSFKNLFTNINNFSSFNLNTFNRDDLEGDKTSVIIAKIIPQWYEWEITLQDQFIELLEGENTDDPYMEDDDKVLKNLKQFNKNHNLALSDKQLGACLNKLNSLPSGHGKYSKKAIKKIIPFLEEGQIEFDALLSAGLEDSFEQKQQELLSRLPRYQDVLSNHCVEMRLKPVKQEDKHRGHSKYKTFRIPNPTVHIAFNQLRLLVNDIIRTHGKPLQIVIETARDLPLGAITKKELEKRDKKNKAQNDEAREAILEFNQQDNRENRLRYRLWKEQKETCLYSGNKISKCKLYTSDLEVDHILPWSKTLDDSFSNKALVYRSSNQNKNNKIPFEYFSSDSTHWTEILERVKELPKNKQWRFNKDALDQFLQGEKSFLERQLNDTRYISKYAKNYLQCICDDVWTVRGQTTSILRNLLYNRKKNRDDYRNHAIDALVIGLMDRSFVQHVSNIANNIEEQNKERLENIGKAIKREILPWPSFKEEAPSSIDQIIVSHRKRKKITSPSGNQTTGQLHNETAYGFLSSKDIPDFSKAINVIHYMDILSFNGMDQKKVNNKIVSQKIKNDFLQEIEKNKKLTKEFLINYHKKTGIRRVRIIEKRTVIPIKNKSRKIYKAFNGDGNHALRLFKKQNGKWDGLVIDRFTANQKSFKPIPNKHRLMINNMLFFNNKFWRIVKLSGKQITLSEHFEANVDKRNKDKNKSYKYTTKSVGALQKVEAKRVDISPCGVVKISPFTLKLYRTGTEFANSELRSSLGKSVQASQDSNNISIKELKKQSQVQ
ncbi:MAG: type II CRISPR RNA-guided endonuclease Cas9 [Bdellovibrionales bacterium]|nr:type II CRISPR RNA-guided endonuclease Cas9 [Bdellovibrionales bacterium]